MSHHLTWSKWPAPQQGPCGQLTAERGAASFPHLPGFCHFVSLAWQWPQRFFLFLANSTKFPSLSLALGDRPPPDGITLLQSLQGLILSTRILHQGPAFAQGFPWTPELPPHSLKPYPIYSQFQARTLTHFLHRTFHWDDHPSYFFPGSAWWHLLSWCNHQLLSKVSGLDIKLGRDHVYHF